MDGGGTASKTGVAESNVEEPTPSRRDVAVGVVVTALVVSGATGAAGVDVGPANATGEIDVPDLGDLTPTLPAARFLALVLLGSSLLIAGIGGVADVSVAGDSGAAVDASDLSYAVADLEPSQPIQRRAGIEAVGYEVAIDPVPTPPGL